MQYMFDRSLFKDIFSSHYLWVGAVELRIYVLKCFYRRQVQSFSDLSVTSKAKVSPPLNGHGHKISPGEP